MSLRNKLIGAAATTVLAGTVAFLPATIAEAAPAPTAPVANKVASTTQPVTGTLSDGSTFTGAISNLRTRVVNGVLTLTGTITGTGLPTGGQQFSQALSTNQLAVNNSCSVLTLNLGPLDLNLLGLVVHLDPVNLNITAVPGAGNLLGNLLCSVAGLLDNGGPVQGISALLNRILTVWDSVSRPRPVVSEVARNQTAGDHGSARGLAWASQPSGPASRPTSERGRAAARADRAAPVRLRTAQRLEAWSIGRL